MLTDINLSKKFLLFVLVGSLNTAFGFLLYSIFLFLEFRSVLAMLFATVIGVFFNFYSLKSFVFNDRVGFIFKYFFSYAIVYALNATCLLYLTTFGLDQYFAGFLSICFSVIPNFLLCKHYVYR